MPKAMMGISAAQNQTLHRRGKRAISQNSSHKIGTVVAMLTPDAFQHIAQPAAEALRRQAVSVRQPVAAVKSQRAMQRQQRCRQQRVIAEQPQEGVVQGLRPAAQTSRPARRQHKPQRQQSVRGSNKVKRVADVRVPLHLRRHDRRAHVGTSRRGVCG